MEYLSPRSSNTMERFNATSSLWKSCAYGNEGRVTFRCGSCPQCPFVDTRKSLKLPDGSVWKTKHFVNCNTSGVIYMFVCPCGAFYIEKTRGEFRIRMREHIYAANIGDLDSPIVFHIARVHKCKTTTFKFIALDGVHPNVRGGTDHCLN